MAGTSLLLFAWLNPIISVFSNRWIWYMIQSYFVFFVLAVGLIFVSSFFSELSIANLPSHQLTIQAILVSYLAATMVAGIFKAIVLLVSKM